MQRALYPGTFDPITNGHLDVLERACQLFDEVLLAVAPNEGKNPMFTLSERLELAQEAIAPFKNARAVLLEGLTVAFAKSQGATVLVRGLRAISDFEYEFQLAQMNRHLDERIETIFLMPSQKYFYTSSNIVKSVAVFDPERVDPFLPDNVMRALRARKAAIAAAAASAGGSAAASASGESSGGQ